MKTLTTALVGTGAGAIVLLAYLALQQQQEVRQDVRLERARFERDSAAFDKTFEQKWRQFDGKSLTAHEQQAFDRRLQAAEAELVRETARLQAMETASDKTLSEMRDALDALDTPQPRHRR